MKSPRPKANPKTRPGPGNAKAELATRMMDPVMKKKMMAAEASGKKKK